MLIGNIQHQMRRLHTGYHPGPDGGIIYYRHLFFDTERMCLTHRQNFTRRCTCCHRFEPVNEPFADLNDGGRCTCYACCRSVIVDSEDAQPLWTNVVKFFEEKLGLPIPEGFREIPILIVGYNALNDQMNTMSNVHGGASQIMTRGLCLTEHESLRTFQTSKMRYDSDTMSFVSSDDAASGYSNFEIPKIRNTTTTASVTAILCLSGLPRDLSASILAHEATHAWIKLHPDFDVRRSIPSQVEEGCAQLIARLFLDELDNPSSSTSASAAASATGTDDVDNNRRSNSNNNNSNNRNRRRRSEYNEDGPTDTKLRQYFKFTIDSDDHIIYGEGYRRAAAAYNEIGIESLLEHVIWHRSFPVT